MLNTNNIDIDDTLANTKTTGAYAGIFSKYDLEDFYLLGSFRMGYEHTKLNRNVNIGALVQIIILSLILILLVKW